MKLTSMCSICNVLEHLYLPWVGPMLLTITGILAALSLFAWPLLLIWPIMLAVTIGLMAGYGACTECHIA